MLTGDITFNLIFIRNQFRHLSDHCVAWDTTVNLSSPGIKSATLVDRRYFPHFPSTFHRDSPLPSRRQFQKMRPLSLSVRPCLHGNKSEKPCHHGNKQIKVLCFQKLVELFCGRFPPSPRGNVGEMFELFCGRFPPSPRGNVGEMFELFCGRFPPPPQGNVGEMFELFCGRFPPSPRGDVGEMFDALNVRPAPPFGGETEQNHALKINWCNSNHALCPYNLKMLVQNIDLENHFIIQKIITKNW